MILLEIQTYTFKESTDSALGTTVQDVLWLDILSIFVVFYCYMA